MKKMWIVIFIIIAVVLVAVFCLSLFLASFVMTGKRQTVKEAFAWQSEHYDTTFYGQTEKTDYTVKAEDGYILNVELLKCKEDTAKYVIISHGYTDNRMGALKYAKMYLKMGFNCIIYDLRGHGENESTFTTYGIREGKDIISIVKDTRNRYKNIEVLGLHGESLGAASSIASLKYNPKIDFAVADCGFSDIDNVLRLGYKNAKVPTFLVDLTDIGAKVRYRYSIKKMRPIDALKDNKIPVLFIHGGNDDFILPKNSKDMYNATNSKKQIHIIEGAGHAESILVNEEEYRETVEQFLKDVLVNN